MDRITRKQELRIRMPILNDGHMLVDGVLVLREYPHTRQRGSRSASQSWDLCSTAPNGLRATTQGLPGRS